jgi:splicing factor 45
LLTSQRKRQQQVFHAFDPEEEYDPNRPNDLGEYQRYREQVRAERRAAYMESKRKRAAGVYDSDSSEYSDDAAPRRDGESP